MTDVLRLIQHSRHTEFKGNIHIYASSPRKGWRRRMAGPSREQRAINAADANRGNQKEINTDSPNRKAVIHRNSPRGAEASKSPAEKKRW